MTIGTVPFLNAVPLTWALDRVGFEGQLVAVPPAELTSLLLKGDIDAGLVPIVDYLRGVGDAIVEGISIAADGDIASVLLVSKVAVPLIETVAVDRGSKTSVALLRIVLADKYGLRPLFIPSEPDGPKMLERAQACLLIGDAALKFEPVTANIVLDLGAEWKNLTGLPFVFAAWVLRADVDQAKLAQTLKAAKEEGLKHLEEVARTEGPKFGFDPDFALRYLSQNIHFDLSERHLRAISTFGELCVSHGIIEQNRSIRLV